MDLYKAVEALHKELRKVDQAIATLETLISGKLVKPASRRGRKSMSPEERKAVSERMRLYWQGRRTSKPSNSERTRD